MSKTLVGNSTTQDKDYWQYANSLSSVRKFPCFVTIYTKLYEITKTSTYPFPLFPYHHT